MILKILNKDNMIEQQCIIDSDMTKEIKYMKTWIKTQKNFDKFENDFNCFYLFEPLKSFETDELDEFLSHIIIEEDNNCENIGHLRDSLYNFFTNLRWRPYYYRMKYYKYS